MEPDKTDKDNHIRDGGSEHRIVWGDFWHYVLGWPNGLPLANKTSEAEPDGDFFGHQQSTGFSPDAVRRNQCLAIAGKELKTTQKATG